MELNYSGMVNAPTCRAVGLVRDAVLEASRYSGFRRAGLRERVLQWQSSGRPCAPNQPKFLSGCFRRLTAIAVCSRMAEHRMAELISLPISFVIYTSQNTRPERPAFLHVWATIRPNCGIL